MSDPGAYSRIYWTVIDDPKFANVYDDDRALACWVRLLLVADQAWPASAHVPAGTNPKALAILVGAELVDIGTGRRYRIHGLDAERARRQGEQRNGGVVRAENAVRDEHGRFLPAAGPAVVPALATTGGSPAHQLSKAETSKDETRRADARGSDEAFETLGRIVLTPTPPMLRFLDELREEFGDRMTAWAIAQANAEDSNDRRTLLSRAKRYLIEQRRSAERQEADDEKARNAAKRQPVVIRPVPDTTSPEQAEAEIAAYRQSKGKAS